MRMLFCLMLGSALTLVACDANVTTASGEPRTYTISLDNGEASKDAAATPDSPGLPELKPNQFGANGVTFDVLDSAARVNQPGRVTVAFTSFKIETDELREEVTQSGATPMLAMFAPRSDTSPYIAFTFFLTDETKGLALDNIKSWFCSFYIIRGKAFAYQYDPDVPGEAEITRLEGALKAGGTVALMASLPPATPTEADADYYYFSLDRLVGLFTPAGD